MLNKLFTRAVLLVVLAILGWGGVYVNGILKGGSEEFGVWIVPLDIGWAFFMLLVFFAGVWWAISTGYWLVREILHAFAWAMSSIIHCKVQPYESWAVIHAREEAAAAEWARTHPASYSHSSYSSPSSSSSHSSSGSGWTVDTPFWQRAIQTSYQQAVREELGDHF